jgi:hypothetical protein
MAADSTLDVPRGTINFHNTHHVPSVADARDAVIAAARAWVFAGPSGDRDNPTDAFKLAADLSRAVRTLVDAEETWGAAADLVRGAEDRAAEKERLATEAWAEVRRLRAALREAHGQLVMAETTNERDAAIARAEQAERERDELEARVRELEAALGDSPAVSTPRLRRGDVVRVKGSALVELRYRPVLARAAGASERLPDSMALTCPGPLGAGAGAPRGLGAGAGAPRGLGAGAGAPRSGRRGPSERAPGPLGASSYVEGLVERDARQAK